MSDGWDMAPSAGCMLTLMVLALIGAVALIYAVVKLAYWLAAHVHIS